MHRYITAALKNDRSELVDYVKCLFDCREAKVADDGRIWIAGPQDGHWLDAENLDLVDRSLWKAGFSPS